MRQRVQHVVFAAVCVGRAKDNLADSAGLPPDFYPVCPVEFQNRMRTNWCIQADLECTVPGDQRFCDGILYQFAEVVLRLHLLPEQLLGFGQELYLLQVRSDQTGKHIHHGLGQAGVYLPDFQTMCGNAAPEGTGCLADLPVRLRQLPAVSAIPEPVDGDIGFKAEGFFHRDFPVGCREQFQQSLQFSGQKRTESVKHLRSPPGFLCSFQCTACTAATHTDSH